MDKITVTYKHRGKLAGFSSINTSMIKNEYCNRMSKVPGTICEKCYGKFFESNFPDCHKSWTRNLHILTTQDIKPNKFKITRPIRLQSVGELSDGERGILQFKNLLKIVRHNPNNQFTIWTKRPSIVHAVLHTKKDIPANLILIYSSPVINKRSRRPALFNKVFTVYTEEYVKTKRKSKRVKINCAGKKCIDCMICYTNINRVRFINEILRLKYKKGE